MSAVVLVEGESDGIALRTLATRRGVDLEASGVAVVVMGGITNIFAHLRQYRDFGGRLGGRYDAAEERHLRSALDRVGVPADGFFGCDPDLEYELIRALGPEAFEALVASEGDGRSLGLLAGMPAQQGWAPVEVFHRFLGSQGGRKARYARRMVEALDLAAVPVPLTAVLDHALRA